jgi:hypothetical protein
MLGDQVVGEFGPDPAGASPALESAGAGVLPVPRPWALPEPDPAVVDSARLRIAAHRVLSAEQPIRHGSVRHAQDIQAIHAVIDSAENPENPTHPEHRADVLDVGAALVVLCDLRLYLDGLEADLLDAAQQVGLGWDVIAAIIGIPADQAQSRHCALRAQRRSPQPDQQQPEQMCGPGA